MKVIMDFLTFLLAAIVSVIFMLISVVFMLINGALHFFEMLFNLIAGAC